MSSKVKNVYIGFAVDMDRAYDTNSRDGRPLRIDHPKYLERCKHKKIFEDGMEKLFQYFKSIGAESAVTWFVNEASFLTTQKFPEILKKCVETGGEIGMHTHFNSSLFNSTQLTMPENPEVWEKEGIIEPKKRLEDFLKKIGATQKKVTVFKAGNHIRNKCMFEKLVKHGFKIDTTCVSNHKVVRKINGENVTLFDDTDISTEPFKMETKNGYILEIPEMRYGLPYLKKLLETYSKENLFIRLQIHPWEALETHPSCLINSINNIINYINPSYNIIESEEEFKKLQEEVKLQIILYDKEKEGYISSKQRDELFHKIKSVQDYNDIKKNDLGYIKKYKYSEFLSITNKNFIKTNLYDKIKNKCNYIDMLRFLYNNKYFKYLLIKNIQLNYINCEKMKEKFQNYTIQKKNL